MVNWILQKVLGTYHDDILRKINISETPVQLHRHLAPGLPLVGYHQQIHVAVRAGMPRGV